MQTILILLAGLLAAALLFLIALGYRMAGKQFSARFDGGGDYFPYYSALHPGWCRTPFSCENNHGETLRGFLFSSPESTPKAIIVVYHGYGMSLDDYLPECAYFCRRGYLVLALDGSGVGHSDGVLRGLPQHILDLKSCLQAIRQDPSLSQLPLLLYGHSWGGYGADCVSALGDFSIRGIVSASGFYHALAALAPHARRHYGVMASFPLLGVRLYQLFRFGRLAGTTAVQGLRRTTCPVLITQSDDDKILPYRKNYLVLYREFHTDPRFTFLPLTGKNHNITTPPEIDREKRQLLTALRSPQPPREAIERIQELKTQVDEALLCQFADFFDSCL